MWLVGADGFLDFSLSFAIKKGFPVLNCVEKSHDGRLCVASFCGGSVDLASTEILAAKSSK